MKCSTYILVLIERAKFIFLLSRSRRKTIFLCQIPKIVKQKTSLNYWFYLNYILYMNFVYFKSFKVQLAFQSPALSVCNRNKNYIAKKIVYLTFENRPNNNHIQNQLFTLFLFFFYLYYMLTIWCDCSKVINFL